MRSRLSQVVLLSALVLGLGVIPGLTQVSTEPPAPSEADFSDVSAKFVRNMRLLESLLEDAESKKMMTAVIGQADSLSSAYRAGNAGSRREDILKLRELMKQRETLKEADQKRLQKLQDEVNKRDEDGQFSKGRSSINASIGELQKKLGHIYTTDSQQKDVIRLIRQHLQFYTSALGRLS
ncbi:MAG: hypothetical protein HC904_08150 [Blastochloris sp.]|nr:hypothetical protein [Blastochloris sp.]